MIPYSKDPNALSVTSDVPSLSSQPLHKRRKIRPRICEIYVQIGEMQ